MPCGYPGLILPLGHKQRGCTEELGFLVSILALPLEYTFYYFFGSLFSWKYELSVIQLKIVDILIHKLFEDLALNNVTRKRQSIDLESLKCFEDP